MPRHNSVTSVGGFRSTDDFFAEA